jgi:hypothetical protein
LKGHTRVRMQDDGDGDGGGGGGGGAALCLIPAPTDTSARFFPTRSLTRSLADGSAPLCQGCHALSSDFPLAFYFKFLFFLSFFLFFFQA